MVYIPETTSTPPPGDIQSPADARVGGSVNADGTINTPPVADPVGGAFDFTPDTSLTVNAPAVNTAEDKAAFDALGGAYNTIKSDQIGIGAPGYDASSVGTDLASNVNVKAGSNFVTPAMMVEDRMARLLSPDNPLFRATRARGDAIANSLGLQSSRKGAAISEGLVLDKAQSIAEKDAATQSAFGQLQAKTDYGIEDKKASGIVSGGLNEQQWKGTNIISAFDKAAKGADAVTNAKIEGIRTKWEQDYNSAITNFQTQFEDMVSKRNITAAVADASKARVAEAVTNYQIFAENTITSPEMIDKGWEAVANVLNQGANLLNGYMQYEVATTGADDTGLSNFVDSIKWSV